MREAGAVHLTAQMGSEKSHGLLKFPEEAGAGVGTISELTVPTALSPFAMYLISFGIHLSFNAHEHSEACVITVTSRLKKYYSSWKPRIAARSLRVFGQETQNGAQSAAVIIHGRNSSLTMQLAFTS